MKIESVLKQLKKEYRSVGPRAEFQKKGWEELRGLLDEQNRKYWFARPFVFRWVVAFLILFLMSGGTIVAAAQKASPGDTLYPVKQFSQSVVKVITQSKILPVTPKIPEVEEPLKTEERKAESSPSAGNEKREEKEKIKHEIEKAVEERKKKIELPIKLEVKGEEVKKEEKKEEKQEDKNPVEQVEEKVKKLPL